MGSFVSSNTLQKPKGLIRLQALHYAAIIGHVNKVLKRRAS